MTEYTKFDIPGAKQPTQEELEQNTEKFRKEHAAKLRALGRHFVYDRISDYERALAERALAECKNSDEWKALEADDLRFKATGNMTEMCASELLDRYRQKAQQAYAAEAWFLEQIEICNTHLDNLKAQEQTPSIKNKIKHWTERKLTFEQSLSEQTQKVYRYERLTMKWWGIMQKINLADIAADMKNERRGNGNKYGFNPNMASRETATGIFEED